MIRRGNLSLVERIIATIIGVAVCVASLVGLAVAVANRELRLMLASLGCIGIAAVFVAAGLSGRPLPWRGRKNPARNGP